MNAAPRTSRGSRRQLREVTCPHCWHRFAPEDVLWIARDPELRRDPLLGDQPARFRPSRFAPDGKALDERGQPCEELACPRCHLGIVREAMTTEPMFLSMAGDMASGKSFLLATTMKGLRETLPHDFLVNIRSCSTVQNEVLNGYLASLFGRTDMQSAVPLEALLAKTQMEGVLYDKVTFDQQIVSYPRPFAFLLSPRESHPQSYAAARLSRLLYLYDFAGENYRPGVDLLLNPCADHLALSEAILFLFDPSLDARFRGECRCETQARAGEALLSQQVTILETVIERVRARARLGPSDLFDHPLVVVMTKLDAWAHLLENGDDTEPWGRPGSSPIAGLDLAHVQRRSQRLRALMMRYCRDFVGVAEGFAREVVYIGVSALGHADEASRLSVDPTTGKVCIRPRDIQPCWAAVPMLYAISRAMPGLVGILSGKGGGP